MARPTGTDGSDHQYRQVIHNKYKNRATARKYITLLSYLVVPAHVLRAAWHSVPLFMDIGQPTTGTYLIGGMMLLSACLQLSGLSTKPQPNHNILMTSNIIMLIAFVLDGLVFWRYHVMSPKDILYPELIAKYFMIHKAWAFGRVKSIASTVEATVSAVALLTTGACVYMTFNYTMDISGKNDKIGGTNWNPRMALAGAKEERIMPEQLESSKDQ